MNELNLKTYVNKMLHILVGNQMEPGQEANPDLWWKKLELSKQGRKKIVKRESFQTLASKNYFDKIFFFFQRLVENF